MSKFSDSPYFLLKDFVLELTRPLTTEVLPPNFQNFWDEVVFSDLIWIGGDINTNISSPNNILDGYPEFNPVTDTAVLFQTYDDIQWNAHFDINSLFGYHLDDLTLPGVMMRGDELSIVVEGGRYIDLWAKTEERFIPIRLKPLHEEPREHVYFRMDEVEVRTLNYDGTNVIYDSDIPAVDDGLGNPDSIQPLNGEPYHDSDHVSIQTMDYTYNIEFGQGVVLDPGTEIYFRKDSTFHDWLKDGNKAEKYYSDEFEVDFVTRNYVNTDKIFIYFGKIYNSPKDSVEDLIDRYQIVFHGLKDWIQHALPANNRKDLFIEFLDTYFDMVYSEGYQQLKDVWSLRDAMECNETFLSYVPTFYGITRYDDIKPWFSDIYREYARDVVWLLKRKGTYASMYIIKDLLCRNTINEFDVYERWHDDSIKVESVPYEDGDYPITTEDDKWVVSGDLDTVTVDNGDGSIAFILPEGTGSVVSLYEHFISNDHDFELHTTMSLKTVVPVRDYTNPLGDDQVLPPTDIVYEYDEELGWEMLRWTESLTNLIEPVSYTVERSNDHFDTIDDYLYENEPNVPVLIDEVRVDRFEFGTTYVRIRTNRQSTTRKNPNTEPLVLGDPLMWDQGTSEFGIFDRGGINTVWVGRYVPDQTINDFEGEKVPPYSTNEGATGITVPLEYGILSLVPDNSYSTNDSLTIASGDRNAYIQPTQIGVDGSILAYSTDFVNSSGYSVGTVPYPLTFGSGQGATFTVSSVINSNTITDIQDGGSGYPVTGGGGLVGTTTSSNGTGMKVTYFTNGSDGRLESCDPLGLPGWDNDSYNLDLDSGGIYGGTSGSDCNISFNITNGNMGQITVTSPGTGYTLYDNTFVLPISVIGGSKTIVCTVDAVTNGIASGAYVTSSSDYTDGSYTGRKLWNSDGSWSGCYVDFTVTGGVVDDPITVTAPGIGYSEGQLVHLDRTDGAPNNIGGIANPTYKVLTTHKGVLVLTANTTGNVWQDGTYYDQQLAWPPTTGSGSGGIITFSILNDNVTFIGVTGVGGDYAEGDLVSVDIGASVPEVGFRVNEIQGIVQNINPHTVGDGYRQGDTVTINVGDKNATFQVASVTEGKVGGGTLTNAGGTDTYTGQHFTKDWELYYRLYDPTGETLEYTLGDYVTTGGYEFNATTGVLGSEEDKQLFVTGLPANRYEYYIKEADADDRTITSPNNISFDVTESSTVSSYVYDRFDYVAEIAYWNQDSTAITRPFDVAYPSAPFDFSSVGYKCNAYQNDATTDIFFIYSDGGNAAVYKWNFVAKTYTQMTAGGFTIGPKNTRIKDGEMVYVYGDNSIFSYNLGTDTWATIATGLDITTNPSLVVYDGNIYYQALSSDNVLGFVSTSGGVENTLNLIDNDGQPQDIVNKDNPILSVRKNRLVFAGGTTSPATSTELPTIKVNPDTGLTQITGSDVWMNGATPNEYFQWTRTEDTRAVGGTFDTGDGVGDNPYVLIVDGDGGTGVFQIPNTIPVWDGDSVATDIGFVISAENFDRTEIDILKITCDVSTPGGTWTVEMLDGATVSGDPVIQETELLYNNPGSPETIRPYVHYDTRTRMLSVDIDDTGIPDNLVQSILRNDLDNQWKIRYIGQNTSFGKIEFDITELHFTNVNLGELYGAKLQIDDYVDYKYTGFYDDNPPVNYTSRTTNQYNTDYTDGGLFSVRLDPDDNTLWFKLDGIDTEGYTVRWEYQVYGAILNGVFDSPNGHPLEGNETDILTGYVGGDMDFDSPVLHTWGDNGGLMSLGVGVYADEYYHTLDKVDETVLVRIKVTIGEAEDLRMSFGQTLVTTDDLVGEYNFSLGVVSDFTKYHAAQPVIDGIGFPDWVLGYPDYYVSSTNEREAPSYRARLGVNNEPLTDLKMMPKQIADTLYDNWEMTRPIHRQAEYEFFYNPFTDLTGREYSLYEGVNAGQSRTSTSPNLKFDIDNYIHIQNYESESWTIRHELDTENVVCYALDSDLQVMVPLNIEVLSGDVVRFLFPFPIEGVGIISRASQAQYEDTLMRLFHNYSRKEVLIQIRNSNNFIETPNLVEIYTPSSVTVTGQDNGEQYVHIAKIGLTDGDELGDSGPLSSEIWTFTDNESVWVIETGFNGNVFVVECYGTDNKRIVPDSIDISTLDGEGNPTITIVFPEIINGFAAISYIGDLVSFGGTVPRDRYGNLLPLEWRLTTDDGQRINTPFVEGSPFNDRYSDKEDRLTIWDGDEENKNFVFGMTDYQEEDELFYYITFTVTDDAYRQMNMKSYDILDIELVNTNILRRNRQHVSISRVSGIYKPFGVDFVYQIKIYKNPAGFGAVLLDHLYIDLHDHIDEQLTE